MASAGIVVFDRKVGNSAGPDVSSSLFSNAKPRAAILSNVFQTSSPVLGYTSGSSKLRPRSGSVRFSLRAAAQLVLPARRRELVCEQGLGESFCIRARDMLRMVAKKMRTKKLKMQNVQVTQDTKSNQPQHSIQNIMIKNKNRGTMYWMRKTQSLLLGACLMQVILQVGTCSTLVLYCIDMYGWM